MIMQSGQKIVFVNVIGYREIRDIDEFVAVTEFVNDNDVVMTALNQLADEVTADKAGAAGNDMPVRPATRRR